MEKIYKQSIEHRMKLSIANANSNVGCVPWNKNIKMKPMSEEHKAKIRNTMIERHISPLVKFKKGYIMSDEIKQKLIKYHTGLKHTSEEIVNMKKNHVSWIKGKNHSLETCKKISKTRKEKIKNGTIKLSQEAGFQKGHAKLTGEKWKEWRRNYVFPKKDTKIEIKIQDFLKQIGIEFFTHQYIKEIQHSYQCDILIPSMNMIIECDGTYWHKYPIGNEIDHIRTSELLQRGFKVLRLWEFEINKMSMEDFKNKLEERT